MPIDDLHFGKESDSDIDDAGSSEQAGGLGTVGLEHQTDMASRGGGEDVLSIVSVEPLELRLDHDAAGPELAVPDEGSDELRSLTAHLGQRLMDDIMDVVGTTYTAEEEEDVRLMQSPAQLFLEQKCYVQKVLSSLPSVSLQYELSEQCAICQDKMQRGQEVRHLPCCHAFHRECIERWLMTLDAGRAPCCPIDNVSLQKLAAQAQYIVDDAYP